ncbi:MULTISPECIES: preprotein translocase subunit SecY [unclassified Wenzhouxiangella]|uniref:preprotein translocase subunit SecY n=1 Tax=unclassified Wenzhouxiangella TaxID=2613841 RepID=UPI000E32868E|nr:MULTISPECIES: preprotein translocase subunit SecY [unclassified Wenzhouxiangella]RFF26456.1 preprotein translocase subunit SecY [Wenzhouxiangella sp. 15181]RFP67271.1 preprotein translocase subunit SecY [Wenzhouxiangella sp. 15190]
MARNPSEMAGMLGGIGRLKELRQRLFVVLVALLIFRFGTFIPVPGINPIALVELMDQSSGTIVDVFNMFSGGALGRFSIFALGVMPYISAAIIIQLMSHAIPQLQQLRKEGESGRRKITQYTRYFTVVLASFQSFGVAMALQSQSAGSNLPVVISPGPGFVMAAVITLTAGTVFLMWLGEQITERGIGNGISILIFAGIVAELPRAIGSTLELVRTGQLGILTATFLLVLALAVTAFVVFVERGQRRITVNYAQRQGRQAYRSQSTHLPLKVNMAGVIPAIFASSLVLFPATISTWFGEAGQSGILQTISQQLSPGQPIYIAIFGGMVMFFCFFYTAIVFNSKETADNLKKSGAFIPGIRPGRQTAEYIDYVLTRLTLVGAFYLAAVCLLPEFLIMQWNVPFYFGGTSLLIIVIVTMDFMAQLQAHLMSHQYDSLLKKSNLKGYGRSGVVRR